MSAAFPQKQTIAVTTASGAATVYSTAIRGEINWIKFVSTDMDAGTDVAVTSEDSAQPILSPANIGGAAVSTFYYPAVVHNDNLTEAAVAAFTKISIANERIKFVFSSAVGTQTGSIVLCWG